MKIISSIVSFIALAVVSNNISQVGAVREGVMQAGNSNSDVKLSNCKERGNSAGKANGNAGDGGNGSSNGKGKVCDASMSAGSGGDSGGFSFGKSAIVIELEDGTTVTFHKKHLKKVVSEGSTQTWFGEDESSGVTLNRCVNGN